MDEMRAYVISNSPSCFPRGGGLRSPSSVENERRARNMMGVKWPVACWMVSALREPSLYHQGHIGGDFAIQHGIYSLYHLGLSILRIYSEYIVRISLYPQCDIALLCAVVSDCTGEG